MGRKVVREFSFFKRLLRQARIFLAFGYWVIPIRRRQKAPRLQNWTELRLKVPDLDRFFGHDDNIGCLLGEPSGGLIDIDLDCQEAVRVAHRLLPPTGRIHGRRSKPSSHFWFVVLPAPQSARFIDLDGVVLVEIRSTGQQTIIPPSIHPNGEEMFWKKAKQAGRVTPDELLRAVKRLAACALLARHWPQQGSRHQFVLALAGFLLRGSWSLEETRAFVTAAAFATGSDDEWTSRQRDVDTTLARLEQGQPATGIPRMAALIGDDVVSKLMEWLEISPMISTAQRQAEIMSWPDRPRTAAFHGLAGEIVSLIEPHSESDPVALLSQLLVGFGNLIGRGAHFQVEADKHFANMFVVLVGPTAKARKGSALSHVRRLLRRVDQNWADSCVLSGLSSGEGLIWAVRDCTFSKDGEKLLDQGVDDKRLLAIESEIAQQLKLMAREQNILSTVIRQAWDSGDLRTLTKNSPAQATGAHISIIGHITQQELRRYLNETELGNGFGNRFLWLCVKRSKVLPEGGNLNPDDLLHLTQQLDATVRWAQRVKEVRRSAKARRLWAEVYLKLSEGTAGLMGAVTSRGEAQVTRLALVYALLDRSSQIETKHLEAALTLWDYAESSAQFIFGDSLGDPIADEILRALRVSQTGLSRTEISNLFAGHRKSADLSRALVVLAQSGLASCRPEPTGGRPDERWSVLTGGAKDAKEE